MNIQKSLFWGLLIMISALGCKRNPLKVNLSESTKDIEVVDFNKELFAIGTKDTLNEITDISNAHPAFFDLFTYRIIRVGGLNDEEFPERIMHFVRDTMILNVKKMTDEEFPDVKDLEKPLNKAFKYYQYHFPEMELPVVYTYISGFNQSIVTAENIIGISLDKYLGRDNPYYKRLNTSPQYKILNMHKDKILSDVAYAWGITEFQEYDKTGNLMENIIHQGKLMYFVDALLPDMEDSLKIGYTTKQIEFCFANEAQMWTYLVDKKMLFSNKRMDIIRYINDGPTTSGFPLESPARAGVWIGWQIVRKYMQNNPETTLKQLMINTDYQQILNESQYLPE